MHVNRIIAALSASFALCLAGCTTLDKSWDYDAPGTHLIERQSSFIFQVDAPNARAMGCTGYELCPQVRALLDERMKARGYCRNGYNVNSVSWNVQGQFYAHGPCQPGHSRWWMLES